MKLDQHGCGCTHCDQDLGHVFPCPLAMNFKDLQQNAIDKVDWSGARALSEKEVYEYVNKQYAGAMNSYFAENAPKSGLITIEYVKISFCRRMLSALRSALRRY